MNVHITITGTKEVRRKLKNLGPALYQLKKPMEDIGDNAARYYSNQGFDSQGGVFGAKWSPLKKATALRKARKYPGKSPLVATGTMRDSFTYVASSNQVLIGNKTDYFKYHQSTAPRTRLPRRQMMGVNAPIRSMVRDILQREIDRKIRAS